MNGKNHKLTVLYVLSVSFLTVSLVTVLLTCYYSHMQFQLLGGFCREIMEEYPDGEQTVFKILKSKTVSSITGTTVSSITDTDENILSSFGYRQSDFEGVTGQIVWLAGAGFLAGAALFLFAYRYQHQKTAARIKALTNYLEKVNTGGQGLLLDTSEDEFSRLQDEIYKTITNLYQTRDTALQEKRNYADNLSNIAHQLKTPITAISLSVQMMKGQTSSDYPEQIGRQLSRLTHLEEALLLLSRIDAGTLTMKQNSVDVFTLLTLASDNLQELFRENGISIDIPEAGSVAVTADLDWTMEAVMNLMKNCMEHTKAGTAVHCSYEENPLYVQIRIWDEGQGFAKEDLPHLFERFYRGKDGGAGGIGIGLSLSKEIIELQNGIIRAFNLPDNGACFEIRIYSH